MITAAISLGILSLPVTRKNCDQKYHDYDVSGLAVHIFLQCSDMFVKLDSFNIGCRYTILYCNSYYCHIQGGFMLLPAQPTSIA